MYKRKLGKSIEDVNKYLKENWIDIKKENTTSEHKLNADKLKEAVSNGELVLEWINEVIEKIFVYNKDKVEIIWKFDC